MQKYYCDKCKEEFKEHTLYKEDIITSIPIIYLNNRGQCLRPTIRHVQLCAKCRARWASWNKKFLEE